MVKSTFPELDSLIALPQVLKLADCSRSHIWALCKKHQFPAPIRLGTRFTRWRASEVRLWLSDPQKWSETNGAGAGAKE